MVLQLSIMWNRDILLCFEISLILLSLCPIGFRFLCLLLYKRSDVFAIYFTYTAVWIIGRQSKVSFICKYTKTHDMFCTFEVLQAILASIPFITFNPSIATSIPEDSSIPVSFSLFLQRVSLNITPEPKKTYIHHMLLSMLPSPFQKHSVLLFIIDRCQKIILQIVCKTWIHRCTRYFRMTVHKLNRESSFHRRLQNKFQNDINKLRLEWKKRFEVWEKTYISDPVHACLVENGTCILMIH